MTEKHLFPECVFILACIWASCANAQCLFNETHCACTLSVTPGLCARYSAGAPTDAICIIDNCQANSSICDCSGGQICERKACDSWKLASSDQGPVGSTTECFFVPAENGSASSCVNLIATPSPSAVVSIPPPESSASPAASASSVPTVAASSSGTATADASPAASASPQTTAIISASASTVPQICPNGEPVLDLQPLFPSLSSSGVVLLNTTYMTTYSATESLSVRYQMVEGCTPRDGGIRTFAGGIGLMQEIEALTEPAEGWLNPGYCKLDDSTLPLKFASFGALILKSSGFSFKPTSLGVFDIDNQQRILNGTVDGTCVETVAVFGVVNGEIVRPRASADSSSILNLQDYEVPASAMSDMGVGLPGSIVPGGQMPAGEANVCGTASIIDRVPCLIDFGFDEAIDTMVVLYGYGEAELPASCLGTVFLNSPTVEC